MGEYKDESSNACYVKTPVYCKDQMKHSVIQKDGLNFVSLYFKIRTSDKYDINYI